VKAKNFIFDLDCGSPANAKEVIRCETKIVGGRVLKIDCVTIKLDGKSSVKLEL